MAIIRLPYNHLVVHDIREVFRSYPEMSLCPMCGTVLQLSSEVLGELSDYAQEAVTSCATLLPVSETTTYCCDACGWFALREDVELCECSGGLDHLFAGVLQVFDLCVGAALCPGLRQSLEENARDLLSVPAEKLGELMELALRPKWSPCQVVHVGWCATALGGREDIYLVNDLTRSAWLLQLTRYEKDESPKFDSVWLLNGIIFTHGKPSHMLVTTEDLAPHPASETTRKNARKNATPPYLAELVNAEALLAAFAGARATAVNELLARARRSPSVWKDWVPLPDAFFIESRDLRRTTEQVRRYWDPV